MLVIVVQSLKAFSYIPMMGEPFKSDGITISVSVALPIPYI
jgi:hypothetical protein